MPVTLGDDHIQRLDELDISSTPRPFRRKTWKPTQRRNKNVQQIISETARKEMSLQATQNNSGSSTPAAATDGAQTPMEAVSDDPNGVDLKQASQNLSKLAMGQTTQRSSGTGPVSSYVSIESAPSLRPAQQQRYCDVTGLLGPYTDPKTRLRYHDKELFKVIRGLTQGEVERYLEMRGAHAVLK